MSLVRSIQGARLCARALLLAGCVASILSGSNLGAIKGRIVDDSTGTGIPASAITVTSFPRNPSSMEYMMYPRGTRANGEGQFQFSAPPGVIKLIAGAPGYENSTGDSVFVRADSISELVIALREIPGDAALMIRESQSQLRVRPNGPDLAGRGWVGNVSVERLGSIGDNDFFVAKDGRHYVRTPGDRFWLDKEFVGRSVELDGKPGPRFAWVRDVTLSPDGAHIAYAAGSHGRQVVVADGRAGQEFDLVGQPIFSPDGRQLAYVAVRDLKRHLVVNEHEGPAFDSIGRVIFSPDGLHLAYQANEGGKWHVVQDGGLGPAFSQIEWLRFSSTGGHLAYDAWSGEYWTDSVRKPTNEPKAETTAHHVAIDTARRDPRRWRVRPSQVGGASKHKVWRVVWDGRPGPPGDYDIEFRLSSDGTHCVYRTSAGGKRMIATDAQLMTDYHDVDEFVFDTLSGRCAFRVFDGKRYFLVVDGVPGNSYDWAVFPQFSLGGVHLAYSARLGDSSFMVVDGKSGPSFTEVAEPAFSPTGEHLVYDAVSGGKWLVVWDGVPGPKWDKIPAIPHAEHGLTTDMVMVPLSVPPHFSPDEQHIAYVGVLNNRQFAVLDTTVCGECDGSAGLIFSPDSRRFAYAARRGSSWSVVADGADGPLYHRIEEIHFSPDSRHVAYVAEPDSSSGTKLVVVDSQPGLAAQSIGTMWFSPSGKRLVYNFDNQGASMMVDGQPGPKFGQVWPPSFDADGTVEYLAKSGYTMYRVRHRL